MGSIDGDSLQPKLDEAQRALEKALDEACDVDLKQADTGELIRVEETLAVASKAAKEAVSVRLRRRNERARSEGGNETAPPSTPSDTVTRVSPTDTHRMFEDAHGKRWHAFAVHPSSERASLPEPYRAGWLAFEAEDEMRRMAPIPSGWKGLSDDELRALCNKAEAAPKRVNSIDVSALTVRKFKP